MLCSKCGTNNKEGSIFCQECGAQLSESSQNSSNGTRDEGKSNDLVIPRHPPLSPHLALLALLLPGLAHIIFGQVLKGITIFIVFWVTFSTIFTPLFLLILSIIDGYMVGQTLKAGRAIAKWAIFPRA